MKKILAISGGVDSIVMLHLFRGDDSVVVAHFNHGTRPSADDDEKFVRRLAAEYGLECFVGRAELGENASEEKARISRYEYLFDLAERIGGEVYTAHHLDDLVESMAINVVRGTGWRGLVPFGNTAIRRPFIEVKPMDRADILRYAAEHDLSFRHDPTNTDERYLRNRLRSAFRDLDKTGLFEIYHETNNLKKSIDEILSEILPRDGVFERAWFFDLDDAVALEILRAGLLRADIPATRPQMLDFLSAIRTYSSGKSFNLPGNRLVRLTKNTFTLAEA